MVHRTQTNMTWYVAFATNSLHELKILVVKFLINEKFHNFQFNEYHTLRLKFG